MRRSRLFMGRLPNVYLGVPWSSIVVVGMEERHEGRRGTGSHRRDGPAARGHGPSGPTGAGDRTPAGPRPPRPTRRLTPQLVAAGNCTNPGWGASFTLVKSPPT